MVVQRAYEQGNGFSGKDPSLEEYVEVKVDSVKFGQGAAIVYLRVLDSNGLMIPMHIGELLVGYAVLPPECCQPSWYGAYGRQQLAHGSW